MKKFIITLLLLLGVNGIVTAQQTFKEAALINMKMMLLTPLVTMQRMATIGLSVSGIYALMKAGALLGKIARCEFGCEHHVIDRACYEDFDADDDDIF